MGDWIRVMMHATKQPIYSIPPNNNVYVVSMVFITAIDHPF